MLEITARLINSPCLYNDFRPTLQKKRKYLENQDYGKWKMKKEQNAGHLTTEKKLDSWEYLCWNEKKFLKIQGN